MRLSLIAAIWIFVTATSFLATLWLLDEGRQPPDRVGMPTADLEIFLRPGMLASAGRGTVSETGDGLAIAWEADASGSKSPLDGVFMHTLSAEQLALPSGGRVGVEVEVTAAAGKRPSSLEVQFIQNGLKMGGWHRFPLRPGRQSHTFAYEAPYDSRKTDRLSTIWFRPDAESGGRPVIVHVVRFYLQSR
jgi:hypothetical protein